MWHRLFSCKDINTELFDRKRRFTLRLWPSRYKVSILVMTTGFECHHEWFIRKVSSWYYLEANPTTAHYVCFPSCESRVRISSCEICQGSYFRIFCVGDSSLGNHICFPSMRSNLWPWSIFRKATSFYCVETNPTYGTLGFLSEHDNRVRIWPMAIYHESDFLILCGGYLKVRHLWKILGNPYSEYHIKETCNKT